MKLDNCHLSAYLDGELSSSAVAEVERALVLDPQLRSELTDILLANRAAQTEFSDMLETPASAKLVRFIWQTPVGASKDNSS